MLDPLSNFLRRTAVTKYSTKHTVVALLQTAYDFLALWTTALRLLGPDSKFLALWTTNKLANVHCTVHNVEQYFLRSRNGCFSYAEYLREKA